jgi:Uma2 family endonuclease
MRVEEYLHTSFDGADCEYLEGEIVERNTGQIQHARIHAWLAYLLQLASDEARLVVLMSIRIRINERRYRVADLAAWRRSDEIEEIPSIPPFLAIEILSPDDRPVAMMAKLHDYLSMGVEWGWIIDPYEKTAMVYSGANPTGEQVDMLRTENPSITIPLAEVLNPRR